MSERTSPTHSKPRSRWFLKAALQAERVYDSFHRLLARLTGRLKLPMSAEIYFVVRHEYAVSVKGRILLARTWPHPSVDDPALVNLFHMVRRWFTPERPHTLVRVSAGGEASSMRSDAEGYFEMEIPLSEVSSDELLIEFPESEVSQDSRWKIDSHTAASSCVILSDVDDTVLVTHAGKIFRMIATTLFGNALTRQLFPGVADLYIALRRGPRMGDVEDNPLAYVTSSPYNLHGLLELVFRENRLPMGPCFMTDWGLDEDKWIIRSHRDHKLESICQILSWYPDKPVILIGDSSQHDPQIYVESALAHPGRITMILIHKVSPGKRMEKHRLESEKLVGTSTAFHFFEDHAEAAKLLAEAGWISTSDAERIKAIVELKPASLADRMVHCLSEDTLMESHSRKER